MAAAPRDTVNKKPPLAISSKNTPNGRELPLYMYETLFQMDPKNQQSRARDLKDILVKDVKVKTLVDGIEKQVPDEVSFIKSLREHGPSSELIRWILKAQGLLCYVIGNGKAYSEYDFGFPPAETVEQQFYAESQLPSIKKTKETIQSTSPTKKGPNMHDTPPKPFE